MEKGYDTGMKRLWRNMQLLVALGIFLLGAVAASGQVGAAPAVNPAIAPAAPGAAGNDALLAAKPLQPPHDKAALIRLNAEVDEMMLRSLERRIDIARKAGCSLIVFDMDTYGGELAAAMAISKVIKKLPDEHINTVAWVHDKAYSAGAMISVACQQIVMTREGSIGDCAPILFESNSLAPLPPTERAKQNAPVIQEFDDSAQKNGYNQTILRAMVDVAVEVWELRNSRTGETAFVDTKGKDDLLNQQIPLPGGGMERPWALVDDDAKGGLIDSEVQLLTVGAKLALKMHLSSATVENEQELEAALNIRGNLMELNYSWAERTTVFLTDWWIRGLLFFGMLIFGILELFHPGTTIFGIVAILCLVLLIGAPFLTGLAQVWEIALIVLGLAIVVADLLFFGTMGLLAVPGFILMGIGLVASFVPADPGGGWLPTRASSWIALEQGLGVLVGGTFLALGAFYTFTKYLHLTPGFNRLQLAPAGTGPAIGVTPRSGGHLSAAPVVHDTADRPADDAVFVGAIGRAATDLRPAGKGRFGEHLVGVVSYGSFIEKDAEIEVLEVSGMRVVVKPHVLAASPDAASGTGPAAG